MLVWQKRVDDTRYELRRAGNSQRLYTNGVFHSQYRPDHFLNGGVWDLLWLPLFFKPEQAIRRVIMLGLGSGAAAAKILRFFPEVELHAVDIDAEHIAIAKRMTGLNKTACSLIHADAIDWLRRSDTNYDVIIDDLFGHQQGEPIRVVNLLENNRSWAQTLKSRLNENGLLLVNSLSTRESKGMQSRRAASLRGFKHATGFRQSGYSNVVLAYSDAPLIQHEYRKRLENAAGSRIGRGTLRGLASMRVKREY